MPSRRALLGALLVSSCASRPPPEPPAALAGLPSLSCVPFARALSGFDLRGDAYTWWDAAQGRYARGTSPVPGAVLVISRTARMRQGHVAVVLRQISPREIRVAHANWGSGAERGRVEENVPIVDVSARNDWSLVRVWHGPTADLGTTAYAARGFILPPEPADPARLISQVAPAARRATETQGS